jgi:putative ABC transport system substrate-binding protein
MERRRFIEVIVGGLLAAPLGAEAQQRGRIPLVGVLWHAGSAEEEAVYLGAFRQGLNELGYVEGSTIRLENRFPNEEPERFVSLAVELAERKVDVLVAVTRLAASAAQRATTTIPIVFIVVPDPVGSKLVESLGRPGGNITGLTHIALELSAKRLQILKDALPRVSRVALLVNGNDQAQSQRYISESQAAAVALGLTVQPVELRTPRDFEPAFDKIMEGHLQAVAVGADGLFYQGRAQMAQAALKRRLPLVVYSRETLEVGALLSYGANQQEIFRRGAVYVDKILKGAKPADIPVEQPTKFDLIINLKTAKVLGLTIPQSLLLRADEVIQ